MSASELSPSDLAPGLMLGEGAEIGDGVEFGANVVVHAGTRIGAGCTLQDGAVVGKPGDALSPWAELDKLKLK